MAAILATALFFESAVAARPDTTALSTRRRRMVCRWIVDPVSGRLICCWEPEAGSQRRPNVHLNVVRD